MGHQVGTNLISKEKNMAKIRELEKLKTFILENEGRTYDQRFWLFGPGSLVVANLAPSCGTAGCLAGNTVLMHGYRPVLYPALDWPGQFSCVTKRHGVKKYYVEDLALKILGLTEQQGEKLFDSCCLGWSELAREAYLSAENPMEKARAAVMALDDLIADERRKLERRKELKAKRELAKSLVVKSSRTQRRKRIWAEESGIAQDTIRIGLQESQVARRISTTRQQPL